MRLQGFSLLELVIALLLSSMLGTVLFTTFFQSSRTLRFVDEYAEVDYALSTVLRQMEQDFAGVVQPLYHPEVKGEAQEVGEQKKERTPSFVAKTKNNQLDFVSFVTTNPRSRYVPPLRTSVPQPSLVRVMYKLRESKENKDMFVLMRQESTDLALKSFAKKSDKPPRELTVSDSVQECSLEYLYKTEGEENKEEVKKVVQWGQKSEEKTPLLPRTVKIALTVWDSRANLRRSIEYYMPVYTTFVEPNEQAPKKNREKQSTKPAVPQNNARPRPRPKRRTLAEFLQNGGVK